MNTSLELKEKPNGKEFESDMPQHIAIIMDGNRRWAKRNKFKIYKGHKIGVDAFENILKYLGDRGAKVLTVYAFSTENWKREEGQVKDLLKVISEAVIEKGEDLMKNNVVFKVIGRIEDFPKKIREGLLELTEKMKNNTGIVLNLALSYGGRDEIIRAANKALKSGVKELDEKSIEEHLDTSGLPDPELIVRTGGDIRLSNFLLWQASYSELFFTKTLWPDFSVSELENIIDEYKDRKRNFGK